MTRKVKEILKLVAESPYYTLPGSKTSSPFMCYSLTHAKNAGLISEEEKELAINAIEKYLNKLTDDPDGLYIALEANGLPNSFEDRLKIYRDWKKRPKPWKQEELP